MKRYYPESDGGTTWLPEGRLVCPKTYYVVDDLSYDRVADCESWAEAKAVAEKLNAEWEALGNK